MELLKFLEGKNSNTEFTGKSWSSCMNYAVFLAVSHASFSWVFLYETNWRNYVDYITGFRGKKAATIFFTWHVKDFIPSVWPFYHFPISHVCKFLSVVTTSLYFPCYMKSALKWFFCCSSSVLLYLFNEKLHSLLWHTHIHV